MKKPAGESIIGQSLLDLDTPALLLDTTSLATNIEAMRAVCKGSSVRLRPHTKTHKSPIVAKLQQQQGAIGVCCAKLGEAERLVSAGIDDVMVTTPLTGRTKMKRLAALLPSGKITVVADNKDTIAELNEAAKSAGCILDVIVEVDVGQGRCGVTPGPASLAIAQEISRNRNLHFAGLQGYQGKLQGLTSYEARRQGVEEALLRLKDSAGHLIHGGFDVKILTGGGSGSVAIDIELGGLTELQPGSYVFMDSSYLKIEWDRGGSPPPFRSALSVLAGVVSRPTKDRAIVDCGWKSISCDAGAPIVKGFENLVFEFAGDEHGTIRDRNSKPIDLALGQKIELIPSHCDTTVNLHDEYVVMRDGRVDAVWSVATRGLST